ncbi:MAG: hypothetical protein MUO50_15945 [Longimicrobiales bacterium]|nr:hypothetical protein [Longimicrobiales bacterium]
MVASPKVPGNRLTFRSWGGSAKLTEGFFRYKKRQLHRYVSSFRLPATLAIAAVLFPLGVEGQTIFDWPIRAAPQPEAVLTGAGAVFFNPGSLVSEVGTSQEIWVVHVDGPDATGVRGVATAGVIDLPLGLRGGVGYWHLGIQSIPRTTTSPHHETGEINIAEDVAILALGRNLAGLSGVGGALRLQRGAVGTDAKSQVVAEIGIHHRSTLPLSPRFGLSIRGLGGELETLGGVELALPSLASSRLPIRLGYGLQAKEEFRVVDHRVSLRGSWMDQLHVGIGFSYLEAGSGWTPLWMLGADIGRYSLSVLRESLANGFGAVQFFQVAVRFPGGPGQNDIRR